MRQDTLHKDTSDEDPVDRIVEQWRRQRPELDPSAKHITGRIVRLASTFLQQFSEAYADVFGEYGLHDADFGVLSPLRRAGEPFELTPTELARHRMISSGGMTAALDRLERKGMVVRVPNPNDRRGSLVRLTELGRSVIDRAMDAHTATEHRLISGLTEDEVHQLEHLLRRLVLASERS